MQASFEQESNALASTSLQRVVAEGELEDLRHAPKRVTLMPGNYELTASVPTLLNSNLGNTMLSPVATQNATMFEDTDRHFQDEFRLFDSDAEEPFADSESRESVEDVQALEMHFNFTSSIEEESYVSVKYHVPVGILLQSHERYRSIDNVDDRVASLVILPTPQGFDCKFYSQTKAGSLKAKEDLMQFAMQSASYFIADLKKRQYVPQHSTTVPLHLRYGYPLIVHVNQPSFKNEIDFGGHEIQGLSIRGALTIPQWNSNLHKWEIYHPD
jgi:hypothetical protein